MPVSEPEDFLGAILLENKMAESLADRMQLCKDRYNDIPQCLIDEVRALVAENAIYKERPSKPYEENKMAESLTGRLINLFHRCDSTIRLDSISLIDEVLALEDQLIQMHEGLTLAEANLAEYKYTPQSYDEMWKRIKEGVNENEELKAQLEKCINNRETDSN